MFNKEEHDGFIIWENGCQNSTLKNPLKVAKSYYYFDMKVVD